MLVESVPMAKQSGQSMHAMRVLRLSGECMQINVTGFATVRDLALRVAARLDVAPCTLRLLHDGRMLSKEEAIKDLETNTVIAISVPSSEYGLGPGDFCVTLHHVTARRGEHLDSAIVAEIGKGIELKVLDVGEGRRLLVKGQGDWQGWVSYKTERNEPLVARRDAWKPSTSLSDSLEVGVQFEVSRKVKLHVVDRGETPEGFLLVPGMRILILEIRGKDAISNSSARCVKLIRVVVSHSASADTGLGVEGWILLQGCQRRLPFHRVLGPDAVEQLPSCGCGVVSFLKSVRRH